MTCDNRVNQSCQPNMSSIHTGVSGNVLCVSSSEFYIKHTSLLKPGDIIVSKRPPHGSNEPYLVAAVATIRSTPTHPALLDNRAIAICTIDDACIMPDHLLSFRCIQHNGQSIDAWVPAKSTKNPRLLHQTSNSFHISPSMCNLSLEHILPSSCYSLAGYCVPVSPRENLDQYVLITEHNDSHKNPLDLSWLSVNTSVAPC